MTKPARILIVLGPTEFPRVALAEKGFAVTISKDCDTAFRDLLKGAFDLVLVDLSSARDGIDFIKRVRATQEFIGILILIMAEWGTGEPTLALSAGADAYEPVGAKAIDSSRLITAIERLLSRQAAAAN
jgi:DNA-binding response OmpR family regulator